MASASYPALCRFFLAQLPEAWQEKSRRLWHSLRNSVGRYFRVQLILMGVVFALLTAAFCMLGVRYAVAIAAVTAAIDALPVFGSGLVLLPWAAFSLLTGDFPLGIGLALAYGAVTVVRNCLQVKLLGTQLGLHPLASLLAVYVGWRAMGVWGMVVLPIAAVTVQQLNDEGVIHLWKSTRVPEATR